MLLFTAVTVLVGVLSTVTPAQDAATLPRAQLDVHFGYDGRFRIGYWTPVHVTVNYFGPSTQGTVTITARHGSPIPALSHATHLVHDTELVSGVPVTVSASVLLSNAFHPLRVELHDAHGRLLASETLDLQRRVADSDIFLALDPQARQWSWLQAQAGTLVSDRGFRRGIELVYVASPQRLPDHWIAYHGVTAVAISADFPLHALSESQTEAMRRWVAAGGLLVWSGGHRLEATRSPLAQTLAPLELTGHTRHVKAASLSPMYPPFPAEYDLIVWEGRAREGDVLAKAGDLPLISRARYRRGGAFLMAFDPNQLAASGWSGMGELAREVLLHAAAIPSDLGPVEDAVWHFMQTVEFSYPKRSLVGTVLVLYIITLTGYSYFGTRRRSKLLIAVPVITALFALFINGVLGPLAARSRHAVAEVAVTAASDQGEAITWRFYTVHSFDSDLWHLDNVPFGWTQNPAAIVVDEAAEPDVRIRSTSEGGLELQLPARSPGRFRAMHPDRLPLRGMLTLQEREYRLTVENTTEHDIPFLYYISPQHMMYLGSPAQGETVTGVLPSAVQSTEALSPDWLGSAVASDLRRRASSERLRRLGPLVAAVVAERLRSGTRLLAGDDGFLLGILDTKPANAFAPQPVHESWHVFLLDVRLQGSL